MTAPDDLTPEAVEARIDKLTQIADEFEDEGSRHMAGLLGSTAEMMSGLLAALRTASPEEAAETQAARDVLAERERQRVGEGWTAEHDDDYQCGELAQAAACYAMPPGVPIDLARYWPWRADWWKPTTRRRDLVKAGALILAEIERLDRAASPEEASHG